jgi:flagellar biosynthesis protein FlhF
MQIKRFEAKSMAEAFRNIKQEFGPDAVILSARSLSNENMEMDESIPSRVEVMAATDNFTINKKEDTALKHHFYSKYEDEKHKDKDQKNEKKPGLFNTISEKLDPLKNIRFLRNKSSQIPSSSDDKKKEIKERLLNHGVDSDILEDITDTIENIIRSKKPGQYEDIRSLFIEMLKKIGVDFFPEDIKYPKKKTISLIGLTGVGKTTTLVKLIASEMLKNDREIGVISFDTHRVGSNALLHVYAKIMGFELKCVKDLKEIKTAQKDLKDKQLIFIDTPGVSLNNHKLNRYIKDALEKIQPDEIHLLMHVNTKKSDAEKIIKGFEMFKFNRLLFTKLDETTAYGTIMNQLLFSDKYASYITFGQNIPEDLQSVNFELLADLLLNSRSLDEFSNIFALRRNKSIFQNGLSGISHN